MKKISTLLILLLVSLLTFAQSNIFSKIYYDNFGAFTANGMAKSYDGGLVVCGLYNSSSAVIKVDSLGVIQWAKTIGNGSNETFNAIVRTTDSCFVIAGKILDSGTGTLDIYLLKIDPAGNLLWAKTIVQPEHQEALAIQQTFDGGFILTGYDSYVSPPYSRIIGLKVDSTGDVQWFNLYQGGNNANYGYSVQQTPDSGYAIVGYVENFPPYDGNGFLCKLSQAGNVEWANKYNTIAPGTFYGSDLAVDVDGIYSYYTSITDYAVIKTDFSGNDNWRETISGITIPGACGNCVSSKMRLLPDGNLIIATGTRAFASQSAIVNIDTAGNFNWSQYLMNAVHDVELADDGGFFLLGNGPLIGVRTTSTTNPHVGIIKSDSVGNAAICTYVNPTVSINFGTTTKATLTLNMVSNSVTSSVISPSVTDFNLIEQVSCVDIIGSTNDVSTGSVELFPNPSNGNFRIQLSDLSGNIELKVVDMPGKIVFNKKYNLVDDTEIKVDHAFSKGVYSVIINSKDKQVVSKLVVQ